jgi:hypothetical protein
MKLVNTQCEYIVEGLAGAFAVKAFVVLKLLWKGKTA